MKSEIYHIIADQLRGKISAEDREILNVWIESSADNRKTYDELVFLWEHSGNIGSVEPVIDEEWQRFNESKSTAGNDPKRISYFTAWPPLFKIAAVLIPFILLSITGFIVYNQSLKKQWITVVSGIEKKHLVLYDSTEIWLNQNSTISYPKNLAHQRRVKLNGEAYFKVSKDGTKFRVDAGKSLVQVVGTQFMVENDLDSITRVTVDEGRVIFYSKSAANKQLSLSAGEKGTLVHDQNRLIKEREFSNNTSSWTSNHLVFNNTPLSQVKSDLEKYFDVNLAFSDSMENCLFSGEFHDPQLTNILEIIAVATSGTISQKEELIFISGHSCN